MTTTDHITASADAMLASLGAVRDEHVGHYPTNGWPNSDSARGDVHTYMVGALAAKLESTPGGAEVWATALAIAEQCAAEARTRHAAKGWLA